MAWKPGDAGFSRDETVLAVGLQCRGKRFQIEAVLSMIGVPDKAAGNAARGNLVYFHSGPVLTDRDTEVAYMFDVEDGRIVEFGSIPRFRANAIRQEGNTQFNILDEMDSFDERAFR